MWFVYVLYSLSGCKSYVGFTNDVERRLFEHNVSETRGFTLRYRPWILIYKEEFSEKKQAMERERFFKSGQGRLFIKKIINDYLETVAGYRSGLE